MPGQFLGAIVGGVLGFFIGGPAGAWKGAALGYSLTRPSEGISSPTYGFGPIEMTSSHQLPLPVIYGENKVAGNVIFEDIYGSDDQYLDVQVGLCEGPIESVSDIRINDEIIPGLVHTVGIFRIRDEGWEGRRLTFEKAGTVTWSVLLGRGTAENPAVFAIPKDGTSWGLGIPPSNLDNFHVYETNTTSSRVELSGSFEITAADFGTGRVGTGISLVEGPCVVGYTADDHRASRITRNIEVTVPTDHDAVRLGERDQPSHSINPEEHFPYTAYISAHLDADELELRDVPTITSVVKGRKVRIYTDENNYTEEYTKNPAWVILDIITNRVYGLGKSTDRMDMPSFIAAADWYDELDDDDQPRCEVDMVYDTQQRAPDVLRDLLAENQSMIIDTPGQIQLVPETVVAEEDIAQEFTIDNIIEGSFSYQQASRKDIPNKIIVEYIDPDTWEPELAVYSNDTDIRERGEAIEHHIRAYSIKRFAQAARLARLAHNKQWYNRNVCQFGASIDSIMCEPGDVIKVSHDVPGWEGKKFRVLDIREDEQDNMVLSCKEYHAAVYADEGMVEQRPAAPSLPNPFEIPAHVRDILLTEDEIVLKDGAYVPTIRAEWNIEDDSPFYAGANIYYRKWNEDTSDWENWEYDGFTGLKRYLIKLSAEGQYQVRIVAEGRTGIKADFASAPSNTITVEGKVGFDIIADWLVDEIFWGKDYIRLAWEPIDEADFDVYEVRTDTDFGEA